MPYQALIESFSVVIASIVGLRVFRRLDHFWKIVTAQVTVYVVVLVFAYVVTPLGSTVSNAWLYNAYIFVEITLLLGAVYVYLDGRRLILFVIPSAALFICCWLVELYFKGMHTFFNYAFSVGSLMLTIAFSGILFIELRRGGAQKVRSEITICCVGLIVYFACNAPYFSLFSFLNRNYPRESAFLFHIITDVLANVRYLAMTLALWVLSTKLAGKAQAT